MNAKTSWLVKIVPRSTMIIFDRLESMNNVFSNEVFNEGLIDKSHRYCFKPIGEISCSHDNKFMACKGRRVSF